MPSPNIIRNDVADGIYHVYSRGVNKERIFFTPADKLFFLSLLDRYLNDQLIKSSKSEAYPNYHETISVHAFALVDNHFHMLIQQHEVGQLPLFMQCVSNAFVRYINSTYDRVGPLFQSRYKARLIDTESYWIYISKYIHNNLTIESYTPFSSYSSYKYGVDKPPWLKTDLVLEAFSSKEKYIEYVEIPTT